MNVVRAFIKGLARTARDRLLALTPMTTEPSRTFENGDESVCSACVEQEQFEEKLESLVDL